METTFNIGDILRAVAGAMHYPVIILLILFLLAAGAILAYGGAYALFRMKKGGIAAALPIWCLLVVDLGLMILLVYYRTNT